MKKRKMKQGRIFTDTSNFVKIGYNDEIHLGGNEYRVIGDAKEGRFGLEDPKFWVKKAVDKKSGERKFIKLVFLETFQTKLGDTTIDCMRSPEKEARILDAVSGIPGFMQGLSATDRTGNNVRVLDVVRGVNFFNYVEGLEISHEAYFEKYLPGILRNLLKAFKSIRFLHSSGFRHGDIRNDHIIIESGGGDYVWIDFDYDYISPENPFGLDLFGMGHVLLYAVGKGFHLYYSIMNDPRYGDLKHNISPRDFSLLEPSRFLNLGKLYPYIPKILNDILMHFGQKSNIYYESAEELLGDLDRCVYLSFA